jgi:hypothetical protein
VTVVRNHGNSSTLPSHVLLGEFSVQRRGW